MNDTAETPDPPTAADGQRWSPPRRRARPGRAAAGIAVVLAAVGTGLWFDDSGAVLDEPGPGTFAADLAEPADAFVSVRAVTDRGDGARAWFTIET